MKTQVKITKPEQPNENSAVGYLRNVAERVTQARKDINEAWQISDEKEIDKIASDELDKVTDALVKLLAAWEDISEKDFSEAVAKASTAKEIAEKSALHVWDELTVSASDAAVRAIGKKGRFFTYADLSKPSRLKKEGENLRRTATVLYEKDDYNAMDSYKQAVGRFKNATEEAQQAKFSVSGRTFLSWLQIILTLLTVIAATVVIVVSVRGCGQQSDQISPDTAAHIETNEPNLSK